LEKSFIIAYLLGTMVNGIYLIFNAIKYQKREFGFTGIIYVDYVGIAIIICVVVILLANFQKKIIFTVMLGIFSLASILTQTRNSWLTIFITLAFLFLYLFKNSNRFSLSKMKLGTMAGSFLFILVILFLSVKSVNPSISERATQLTENKRKEIIDKEGTVASSLVSRLLVWQTCLNAIKEHPWIGIGVYAFPYSSKHYHTIPDFLYENYVEGLSPHSGFLGIITETGIVGFLGFLIFYFSALKYAFKSNKIAKSRTDRIITTCLNWSLIYISISLVMTDAWFWGSGIVLWGIILGLNISNRKNLEEQRARFSSHLYS
jgi:O-antigen ligase